MARKWTSEEDAIVISLNGYGSLVALAVLLTTLDSWEGSKSTMFDKSWNSQMHQLEVAEMEKNNLHVFRVDIQDHGIEEVAFQGMAREEAQHKLLAWLKAEPFVQEAT